MNRRHGECVIASDAKLAQAPRTDSNDVEEFKLMSARLRRLILQGWDLARAALGAGRTPTPQYAPARTGSPVRQPRRRRR
ncbi:hypothetical protein NITHO_1040018 [Nitrolancea hollandica Lb]|uniref:Uncharacterized protein n=1 Tax=Nitrolancea hollandica Lb TaxID=1129897 RepID=I4ECI3_9BACT|nr:hypothetical protein NITHO_1040018 [Nitrolancea hollandica Lb]